VNDLEIYFQENTKRELDKWSQYFDIYHRHFQRFRNKEIVLLEVGVSHGGSLQMWKNYFGEKAKIYGIEVNPNAKEVEEDQIEIFIGSQSDRNFLRSIKQKLPQIDILIDDGGHTMVQQKVFYEELFEAVTSEGVYLIEDLHTSYWKNYGGGYRDKRSFIEYSKSFIDQLNAFHSRQRYFRADNFTRTVDSLHFYDSILVIEKKRRTEPERKVTGSQQVANNFEKTSSVLLGIEEEEYISSGFVKRLYYRWRIFSLINEGFINRAILDKLKEWLK